MFLHSHERGPPAALAPSTRYTQGARRVGALHSREAHTQRNSELTPIMTLFTALALQQLRYRHTAVQVNRYLPPQVHQGTGWGADGSAQAQRLLLGTEGR